MKIRLILPLILIILLSKCKKEDKFDTNVIPGGLTGAVYYFTSLSGDIQGGSLPDSSINGGYKASIKKSGSNYVISFDKVHSIIIPDIIIEIGPSSSPNVVGISTIGGQAYSSFVNGPGYQNLPVNYFAFDKIINRFDLNLTLKSNDPNKRYFLWFSLLRV